MTVYDTAIALAVELQRIIATMPDPAYEVRAAFASGRDFLKRFLP